MKTTIKTTIKENESITVSQKVIEVYDSLMDKGAFCMFDRIGSGGATSKMIIKKSVVKIVVERK